MIQQDSNETVRQIEAAKERVKLTGGVDHAIPPEPVIGPGPSLPKNPILSVLGTIIFIAAITALLVINIVHPNALDNVTLDLQIITAMGAGLAFLKGQELQLAQNGLHLQLNQRISEMAMSIRASAFAGGRQMGNQEATDVATLVALQVSQQQSLANQAAADAANRLAVSTAQTLAEVEKRHAAEINALRLSLTTQSQTPTSSPTPANLI